MGAPASTPEQIPNYTPGVDYVGSQNLPPPTRIHPPPLYCDYVKCIWLPESTSPSQNIPPFSTNICDLPRIYSFLPEYTPFSTIICDPPRIYPSLPEYRPYPPFQQLYATLPESTPPSQNIPLQTIRDPPRIYPSLPEYTPFSMSAICDPPRIYPPFQQLYATLPESTHPSQNIPPFSTTTRLCDPPRICPSLLESFFSSGSKWSILSQLQKPLEKGA